MSSSLLCRSDIFLSKAGVGKKKEEKIIKETCVSPLNITLLVIFNYLFNLGQFILPQYF